MSDADDIEESHTSERAFAIAVACGIGLVGSLVGWIGCGLIGLVPGGLGALIGGVFIGSGCGKPGAATALVGGLVVGIVQAIAPLTAMAIAWSRGIYGDQLLALVLANVISVGLTVFVGFVWTIIGFAAGHLMSRR